MVGKREEMLVEKNLESRPRCGELSLRLIELSLRGEGLAKSPAHFWIAAGERRHQERFRVTGLSATQMNLREMHARLDVRGDAGNRLSIPIRGPLCLRVGDKLPPQHAKLKANPCQSEWRDVLVDLQRTPIDEVCLGKLSQIGEQRAQRNQ